MNSFVAWFNSLMGVTNSKNHLDDPLLQDDIELGGHHYIAMDKRNGFDSDSEDDDPEFVKQFYTEVYNQARKYKYGDGIDDGKPLLASDFCYQMISTKSHDENEFHQINVWWMLTEHPICQIILVTARYSPNKNEQSRWLHLLHRPTVLGTLVAYSDEQVSESIEHVLQQCRQIGLNVEAEETPPLIMEETNQPDSETTVEIPLTQETNKTK